jgi:hypothetical protein
VVLSYHPGDRTPFAVDPAVVQNLVKSNPKFTDPSATVSVGEAFAVFNTALADSKAQLNIYGDLVKFAPKGVKVEVLATSPDFKTSDALPGVDLVAEFGSTIAIEAAAQRIPVITISTAVTRERLYSTSKTRVTEPVELRIALEASEVSEIVKAVQDLLVPDQFLHYSDTVQPKDVMRLAQEAECPRPAERGAAVKAIADYLATFAK